MALVSNTIGNLVGGISQQAAAIRLATQSNDEVNTWPVIVDGQNRRPPTELAGVLPNPVGATAYTTDIVRDIDERYVVAISNGAISVCDLEGNPRTVTYPNGQGYLATPAGTTDAENYSALTIADYTFIVNKSVVTAMAATVFPARQPEALINVVAGDYGKTYQITINGNLVGQFVGPTGSETNSDGTPANQNDALILDTSYIAYALVYSNTASEGANSVTFGNPHLSGPGGSGFNAGAGWNVKAYANTIYIQSLTGVDFSISVADGNGGNDMKAIKGDIQLFSDLPPSCPTDFVASILGAGGDVQTRYYIQYQTNSADTTGAGVWKECPQPGIQTSFDPSTMPHVLVRNADGTFTFQEATWDPRVAGDATTVPVPSFIGKAIQSVEFYSNRLGLLVEGNAIWSRSGDLFNYWRTSAIAQLDNDPIDIQAATSEVSTLRAATPYQQSLILWSDLSQFAFSSGNNALLSPSTATLIPVTPYESLSESVRPVAAPRRIYFAVDRDNYTGLREWYYDVIYRIGQADDSTAHVPTLVPSGVYKMANSSIEDTLILASTSDTSSLWVYKYYWQGQEKLQSAWCRWNFPGAQILNIFFVDTKLYILMNRNGQTSLEVMRLNPGLSDSGNPVTYLDRRIGSSTLAAGVYDGVSDTTAYTLPYAPTSSCVFKAAAQFGGPDPQFVNYPVVSISGKTVALQGNTTANSMWFGEVFRTQYDFSPFFYRDPQGAVQEGLLKLLRLDLAFVQSGYFRVEVTPLGRATRTKEWFPETLDQYNAFPGVAVRDGVFAVPVYGDGEFVKVSIVNDSIFPSRFARAEWKGNFVPKTRK